MWFLHSYLNNLKTIELSSKLKEGILNRMMHFSVKFISKPMLASNMCADLNGAKVQNSKLLARLKLLILKIKLLLFYLKTFTIN